MRVPEFATKLGEALAGEGADNAVSTLVMVKDLGTKQMYGISNVQLEVSEEGDTQTLWIEVEEY